MDQNHIKKYLDIKVYPNKTVVKYCNNDNVCFIYEYPIGVKQIGEQLSNELIMSNWISGVMYTLDNISLTDRVPTNIYLSAEQYTGLFEKFLKQKDTYSQFYLEEESRVKGIRVIIKRINYMNVNSFLGDSQSENTSNEDHLNNELKLYERYTKTISQFKI